FKRTPDRPHGLCHDQLRRCRAVNGIFPCSIIKTRLIPAGFFLSGIIMLGGIYAVKYQRPPARLPTLVRMDGLDRAVCVGDAEIRAKDGPVAPGSLVEVPYGGRLVVVPSVTRQYADSVFSLL